MNETAGWLQLSGFQWVFAIVVLLAAGIVVALISLGIFAIGSTKKESKLRNKLEKGSSSRRTERMLEAVEEDLTKQE